MTNNNRLDREFLDRLVRSALEEDIGAGDVTTEALVDPEIEIEASIASREDCRVAGGTVACRCFQIFDPDIEVETQVFDGEEADAGEGILRLRGCAASILTVERTALNFMQRMCGIATLTAKFVNQVAEFNTMILDTRKTTPGLRRLEKYSVVCGGGSNHRQGLFDRVLIKDNHRKLWQGGEPQHLDRAIETARRRFPDVLVEIEVESIEELQVALKARPDWVLLDNMSLAMMRECVARIGGISRSEASGGIELNNIRDVAATGVDAVSLGCLTHSAPAIDLSLEWRRTLTCASTPKEPGK